MRGVSSEWAAEECTRETDRETGIQTHKFGDIKLVEASRSRLLLLQRDKEGSSAEARRILP